MRQCIFRSFLIAIAMMMIACAPKKPLASVSQPDLHKEQQRDPFEDLSLDQIRNSIELFNQDVIERRDAKQSHAIDIIALDEREARLVDIAIPFGARLLDYHEAPEAGNNEIVLGYASMMSVDQLIHFYSEHMERLGWICACCIRGHEQLLVFEKPDRICSMVLRSITDRHRLGTPLTNIVIFHTSGVHKV